jgi:hypothetical protein
MAAARPAFMKVRRFDSIVATLCHFLLLGDLNEESPEGANVKFWDAEQCHGA